MGLGHNRDLGLNIYNYFCGVSHTPPHPHPHNELLEGG